MESQSGSQPKGSRKAPKPEAEGTRLNRKREAQQGIIAALEGLGIERNQWPAFVRSPEWPEVRQTFQLRPFQPSAFEGLHQSPEDWKRKVQAAFQKYLTEQVSKLKYWITVQVETGSSEANRFRGPGKTKRNADIHLRYEWAALRLVGDPWKEIAGRYETKEDRVRKRASEILELACWTLGTDEPLSN